MTSKNLQTMRLKCIEELTYWRRRYNNLRKITGGYIEDMIPPENQSKQAWDDLRRAYLEVKWWSEKVDAWEKVVYDYHDQRSSIQHYREAKA